MSSLAVSPDAVFASFTPVAAGSDATAAVAATGVDPAALQPLWLAVGTTIISLLVGIVFVAGAPTFTRGVSDDITSRPDLAFAAGFVCFFGPLVVAMVPLIGSSLYEHPALVGLTAIVSFPALLLWGLVLLVAAPLGAVAVGVRLLGRNGDSASLPRAAVVGIVLLGASQLVPVLGALVAMGLATVAVGAVARRRFDVDSRLFAADEDSASDRSSDAWKTGRPRAEATWGGDDAAERRPRRPDREDDAADRQAKAPSGANDVGIDVPRRTDRDRDVDDPPDAFDVGGDTNWTVDEWAWDADADHEDGDEASRADDDER